ncbi:MAG: hypothetical protein JXK93_01175 [Sphaerochaetaceae bacterium]|nr:hypothetical protein [Sphaerochaetaceae bacterium]
MSTMIIITGGRNTGKTTMAYALYSKLDLDGKSIGGVIQVLALPDQSKDTYELSSQTDGSSLVMLSSRKRDSWPEIGNFFYNPETEVWADTQFKASYSSDVIVFDEIGRYELAGRGFDKAFRYAVESYEGIMLTVIREEHIASVCDRYGINIDSCVIISSQDDVEQAYTRIRNL